MATGTGLDAQFGVVAETTWNTGVVVTRFFPLISETLKKDIAPIDSAGIYAGRQVELSQQWAQGNASVGGDVKLELTDQSMGLLLKAAFGTVNTVTAGGTGTHTFFPAPPVVSLTAQVGRPVQYGSVIPFTYTGSKVASWDLECAAGQFATWGMTLVAAEEYMGTALASASYATNMRRWTFAQTSLKVDGTVLPVKSYKLSGDNKLAERRFLGSTIISEPLREDLAEYTGEIVPEWGGQSTMGTLAYFRFLGGTESTLVATMVNGTLAATITANVRFDGSTPNVAGAGIVEHAIPFKAVSSGSLDSQALQIVMVNNDTSA